jgi:hypothetical protein
MSSPTNPPSEAELTQYVIDRLGGIADREQLVFDVCRLMGWQWDQADLYIKAVEERHLRRIALGQSPWLFGIALGTLIIGMVATGASGDVLWSSYRANTLTTVNMLVETPRIVSVFFGGIVMIGGAVWGLYVFLERLIRGR